MTKEEQNETMKQIQEGKKEKEVADKEAIKHQIAALKSELKRQRGDDSSSGESSSSSSSDEDQEPDWEESKMKEVEVLILASHLSDSKSHSSIVAGESGYQQKKHALYSKHQSAFYFVGKTKTSGKHLAPPGTVQRDLLIVRVLAACSICARLKREKEAAKLQDEQQNKEWQVRYEHRLVEPEYESDPTHVADDHCGNCGEKAGRKGRVGKRFGSKDDGDDLLNCDGCYNINLLIPRGQFSSRRQGGSDAGRSRYLYCQLNPITSLIIRHEDNMCIVHCEDDGQH